MNEEDKQRLFRNLKLSLYDLEKIVGMVRDRKGSYFRIGDKEETAYLQDLENRLKDFIHPMNSHEQFFKKYHDNIKEYLKNRTYTENGYIQKLYRIRYGKNFTAPHWFTGFKKFRTIIESVNYSQSNFWKAKNIKTAENMLNQIKEYYAECASMDSGKDLSDQFWIEEYEENKNE
jgi:hypothetical protein